jgi:hypothetical protein
LVGVLGVLFSVDCEDEVLEDAGALEEGADEEVLCGEE